MRAPCSYRRRRGQPFGRSLLVVIFITLAISIAASVATWYVMVKRSQATMVAGAHETLLRETGLQRPVTNHLDARFTDADGDLIADPPKDPNAFLDPPTLTFSYIPAEDSGPF